MDATRRFLEARDRLLSQRADPEAACRSFRWPAFEHFNWALDYFDVVARDNARAALRVVDDEGRDATLSYAELALRASQVANFLAAHGVARGDRVLVMLGNVAPLWEVMLGVTKLGAVMIPATTLLRRDDLADRLARGRVKAVIAQAGLAERFVTLAGATLRIAVGGSAPGWLDYEDTRAAAREFRPTAPTRADELLLLYFTSGTTARPKLVAHSHQSYPVGHLSTAYWIGLRAGDVHLNLSSPGWAKHAWSCVYAPLNAEATVLAYQYERFSARALLERLVSCRVTTFCAPPTVWRMLIQEDLARSPVPLREAVSAVVSVWPKPSRIVIPQAERTCSMTSGLSGSPALTTSRSDTRAARRSCWISIRHTVGGAQKVVTLARTSWSSSAFALKRSYW